MTRSENYEAGDTVIFNRRYKTLGVEKGDRREVAGVDADTRTVHLKDEVGAVVEWKPDRIAAAKGGVELFRSESLQLRSGDKVRFTRNDPASGLTNGQVASVESVGKDGFSFRLEGRFANEIRRRRSPAPSSRPCLGSFVVAAIVTITLAEYAPTAAWAAAGNMRGFGCRPGG